MESREIVRAFWQEVFNGQNPDAVDRFVVDDVVIVAGGREISGKEGVKNWVREFLDKVKDLHVDPIEEFQNKDGSRVTSRWLLEGTNNGLFDTTSDGQPIAMTGSAVWEVREDGKLVRCWIETASWEQYRRLIGY